MIKKRSTNDICLPIIRWLLWSPAGFPEKTKWERAQESKWPEGIGDLHHGQGAFSLCVYVCVTWEVIQISTTLTRYPCLNVELGESISCLIPSKSGLLGYGLWGRWPRWMEVNRKRVARFVVLLGYYTQYAENGTPSSFWYRPTLYTQTNIHTKMS